MHETGFAPQRKTESAVRRCLPDRKRKLFIREQYKKANARIRMVRAAIQRDTYKITQRQAIHAAVSKLFTLPRVMMDTKPSFEETTFFVAFVD